MTWQTGKQMLKNRDYNQTEKTDELNKWREFDKIDRLENKEWEHRGK